MWQDNALYFCTGAAEQKGLNLARSANCAVTTGNNVWKSGLDVVIEGDAKRVTDDALLRQLAHAWESKYKGDWHFNVADGAFHHEKGEALVFEVCPTKVLAFDTAGDDHPPAGAEPTGDPNWPVETISNTLARLKTARRAGR